MATLDDITAAYQTLSSRMVKQAGELAGNRFAGLGDWRDGNMPDFIRAIRNDLAGVKSQAARLALAYYRQVALANGEKFVAPVITSDMLTTEQLRNGATAEIVYSRPFVEMRTKLANDVPFQDALDAGITRATSLASTEIELARRSAGFIARGGNDNIVGYVRTLSGFENCALCSIAATQRYHKADLLPIHPGCDCGEKPIYGSTDPGQVLDPASLDATHESVSARFGVQDRGGREPDYRQIMIRNHGELGPVLTIRGQEFTGPNDI